MDKIYKKGDVVELKSGGPEMTVSGFEEGKNQFGEMIQFDGTVYTQWFKDGDIRGGSFHQDMLDLVEYNDDFNAIHK